MTDSQDNRNSFFSSPSRIGVFLLSASLVGLWFLEPAIKHLRLDNSQNELIAFLYPYIAAFQNGLQLFLLGMLISGILVVVLSGWIKNFLEISVKDAFSASIRPNLIDSIDCAPSSELRQGRDRIFERLYGCHITNARSLANGANKTLEPFFFGNRPHRSQIHSGITVVDNNDGTVTWSETSRYKIHCISLDSDYQQAALIRHNDVHYKIRYHSNSLLPNPVNTQEDLDECIKLSIDTEGKTIFDSHEHLIWNTKNRCIDSVIPSVQAEIKSGSLYIHVDLQIVLSSAWTSVDISETNRMSVNDDFYTMSRKEPVFVCSFDITTPNSWEFKHHVFGNGWQIKTRTPNVLSAHCPDWVMPGIIGHVAWSIPKSS